jgi:hypothetical protein
MKWELGDVLVAVFCVTLVSAVAIFGYVRLSAQTECLAAGYPGSALSLYLEVYCIKRVDQTDVVIPLSEVSR